MPVLFRIDPFAATVFTTLVGDVTHDDLAAYREALADDPVFRPTFDELVDASAVRAVLADSRRLRDLASGPDVFAAGARRAILAPTPLMFGLARMMQQVYGGKATVEVFSDRASARAWLGLATS